MMLSTLILLTCTFSLISANPLPSSTNTLQSRSLGTGYFNTAVTLSPINQPSRCLGTLEVPANDVPLFLIPCTTTSTWYGAWEILSGNNPGLRLSGTNFCLDAGLNPHDGGPSKLYTCVANTPQQTWYYTADQHLAITGGTQCLDYAISCGLGGCAPGTFSCGRSSQQWVTAPTTGGSPGYQIHPNGDKTKCLTPTVRGASDGTTLAVFGCIPFGQPFQNLQVWDVHPGTGLIKLHGINQCVDAGTGQTNGAIAKTWTCYAGLFQQTWVYTADLHITISGGTQCLDLRAEDGSTTQTWQCGNSNQQVWTITEQIQP